MSNQKSMERSPGTVEKLESIDDSPQPAFDSAKVFNEWLAAIGSKAFVLAPLTRVDDIPAIYQISRRVVRINTWVPGLNESGPEVYHSNIFHGKAELKKGVPAKVSLGKVGLLKLLAAAGADVKETNRRDDRKDPLYCEFEVAVEITDFDGVKRVFRATKAIDLHDGSPEASSMTPGNLGAARRAIVRLCETKALEASIRGLLMLPQQFNTEELMTKPFIVTKLTLRTTDPDVRSRMIDNALGMTQRLYPGGGDERELKDVEGGKATPALPSAPPASTPAPEPEPPAGPDAADDFEDIDIPAKPAEEPGPYFCGCPCGDQREITLEAVKLGKEKYGSARCKECYPGKGFNVAKHRDLPDLLLPKRPGLTAEDIETALEGGAK